MIPRQLLNSALAGEIQNWYSENLISRELHDTLIARYPAISPKGLVISSLITIGSVMVGLGSLLFIASHWTQISVYAKLILILLAIVISNAAGWWFQFRKGNRPRLGEAFFLLGSFFYGSGIWLVSQMFNISGDLPQGLLLWSVGTSAVALATGSAVLGVMSTALIGIWTTSITWQPGFTLSSATLANFALGTTASIALSYRLRSPWSLANTLIGASIWLTISSHLDAFGTFVWGVILFNLYLLHRNRWQLMAPAYQFIGVFPALGSLLLATFAHGQTISISSMSLVFVFLLLVVCIASSAVIAIADPTVKQIAFGSALTVCVVFILSNLPDGIAKITLTNFTFITVTIGLLYAAVRKLQNPWLMNTAMFFLGFYILCRYCDTFFSLMDRSLFFLFGGTLLMIIGAMAESKRREFLEGLRA